MKNELKKKTCVVTGAAAGIGLGIAEAMARAGARVAMIDIRAEEVSAQVERLNAEGSTAKSYAVDITDRDAVFATFERIRAELGPVFTLVNNAGVVDQRPFEEITGEQIDRMMRVNVNGTLFCCQGTLQVQRKFALNQAELANGLTPGPVERIRIDRHGVIVDRTGELRGLIPGAPVLESQRSELMHCILAGEDK